MRLTQDQDSIVNAVCSNLDTIAQAKDLVVGSPLSRPDMQRIAKASLDALGELWEQIGYSNQPTLGYAPCPWDNKHSVGLFTEQGSPYIICYHNACPMHRVRMSPEEWNRRV